MKVYSVQKVIAFRYCECGNEGVIMNINLSLGEKLQDLRSEQGLSLKALSEALGGSPTTSTLGDYENNRKEPSFEKMIALARFYGVSLDWLGGVIKYRNHKATDVYKSTGLSEEAVMALSLYKKDSIIETINPLLCNLNFMTAIAHLDRIRTISRKYLTAESEKDYVGGKRPYLYYKDKLDLQKYLCEKTFGKVVDNLAESGEIPIYTGKENDDGNNN
jgi:transcriptional regulator with XRE-family HTH domain